MGVETELRHFGRKVVLDAAKSLGRLNSNSLVGRTRQGTASYAFRNKQEASSSDLRNR